MVKLSKAQQLVVDRMNDGWSLGKDSGLRGRAWMQHGGLGRGGKSADVHISTFYVLCKLGAIKSPAYHFPTTEYVLTEEYTNAKGTLS